MRSESKLFSAACIPGLIEVALSSCDATGGNDTVNATSWGCEAGYYIAPAPQYCEGMHVSVGDFVSAYLSFLCCRQSPKR
jgi:hypothetical protein